MNYNRRLAVLYLLPLRRRPLVTLNNAETHSWAACGALECWAFYEQMSLKE
jgi:hypothetical protein